MLKTSTDLRASLLLGHEFIHMSQVRLLWLLLQSRKVLGEVLGQGHGAWQLD